MTVKLKLKDVKDKLREDTLDLSLCDLEEVPVREIVSLYFVVSLFFLQSNGMHMEIDRLCVSHRILEYLLCSFSDTGDRETSVI